jgi:hypothetical protein
LSSEAADVSTETVTDWKKRLNDLCKDYSAEDIFNCDETGLFWRAIPQSPSHSKTRSALKESNPRNGLHYLSE